MRPRHEHTTSTSREAADDYTRHRPEETVLYAALQAHWKTFVAELEAVAEPPVLPAFVVAEVEAFLRCGILSHGLVLAKCRDCGWCRPVAFSCRRRGFCASCIGRRMSDFAAQLVDRVIPRVPIRQWVLTVPHRLRARMMFDPALTSAVLRELIRAISSWLRRRARRQGVVGAIKTGAVTVIQRFNSALGANPHFHTLFLDGVYTFPVGRPPVFHPTPAPTDEDVAHVVAAVFRRVERRLADREPGTEERRFVEDAPVLVAMAEASIGGVVATGPRRGRRIVRVRGAPADLDAFVMGRLCAEVEGFNLQAATRIHADDREGLERMARYLARPPIASDRLSWLEDGRLELRLKRPWRDGTTAFVYTPHELLERLVAIVPRPRAHLTRYFGVFAPAFAARAGIVPSTEAAAPKRRPPASDAAPPKAPSRLPWASLIWRVFLNDVLECARCKGRMEIAAALTSRPAIERVLRHLGISVEAPGFHAARPPPQTQLPFADEAPDFVADAAAPDDFGA
ncbi:MAG TPA: transposase [Polyangia bacterium]|nr:transposase [Polyangia bacterium]